MFIARVICRKGAESGGALMVSSSRSNNLDNNDKDTSQRPDVTPSSSLLEVGDLLVGYLEQINVEYVFGIPGGPIEPLYNALARSARRGGPRPVVARHETGAAFMADGYARATGKLGVCCATTGPGATNMITGVASAYQDNTPLLVITAQSPLSTFGKGAAQESSCTGVNTVEMMRYCTKYSSLVSHIDQLEWKLASALIAAHEQPRGPAHLSIPLDVLRHPVSNIPLRYDLKELIRPIPLFDPNSAERLCRHIEQADNTVFIVGERCGDAITTILELSLLIDADVITTPQGKGLVSPFHPRYRGVFGLAGHKTAISTITNPNVDVVFAIGTSLDELATNGWDESSIMTQKLVHIDSSSQFFSRSPIAQDHVTGDLSLIFDFIYNHFSNMNFASAPKGERETQLIENSANVVRFERRLGDRRTSGDNQASRSASHKIHNFERRSRDRRRQTSGHHVFRHFRFNEEQKCHDGSAPVKPQRLMFDLSRLFPPNTRFVAEIGNSFLWAIHYLQPFNRRISGKRKAHHNVFFMGMGFSSMGWAIGGAVGIALGCPDTPVVCITGDGSFLMTGQEITVAVQEKLPVIFVVLNDASLGTVKHGQKLAFAESVGHALPEISYADIAKAMGVKAHTIKSPDDMAALNIEAICNRQGPTLLDVHIDRDEAPPLGERLEMLASGK